MEIVFNKRKKILLILILTLVFISLGTTIFAAEKFHLGTTAVVMYQDRQYPLTPNKNNVKYKSSNNWFATVDDKGVITAKRIGIITITGTTPDGETATCKVRIKMKTGLIDRIRGMGLNISSATVYKNRQLVINEYLLTNQIKEWKSSDENIVKIDYKGAHVAKLTAKNPGTAEITVTNSRGKKITVDIVVKEPETQATQPQQPTQPQIVNVTGVTLNKTSANLEKGKTTTLTLTVSPTKPSNKEVTWKSADTNIVSVSSGKTQINGEGKTTITLTANKAGNTTISATIGGKTAKCEVTVKENFYNIGLELKEKIANAGAVYSQGTFNFTSSTPIATKKVDCSSYVSYVIYEYGKRNGINEYKNAFVNSKGCTAMKNWFDSNSALVTKIGNLKTVASQGKLKAGDILIRNTHVEIYSYTKSNGQLYTLYCGGPNSVSAPGPWLGYVNDGYGGLANYTVYRLVK